MRCSKARSLIPAAIDRELDEASRARLAAHAADCPECRAERDFQTSLAEAIARRPMPAPPDLYFEGVLAEIHRRIPTTSPASRGRARRRRVPREWFATAAVLAMALCWAGLAADFGERDPGPASRLAAAESAGGSPVRVSRPRAVAIVAVQGIGLVSADSQLLQMPVAALRELGLNVSDAPARRVL